MATHSVKKNFLWNASYQVLVVLAPLVTTPYLSRILGAEQIGVYSYTYSVTNYFVLFAMLGMSNYGVRIIASASNDREKRSRLFWSTYTSQLCVCIPVTVVYAIYCFANPRGGELIAAVWSLWVLSAGLDISWLFFGVEEFKMPTIRSFITKIASIVAIFLFVKGPEDLWIYCLAIAASYFLNQLMVWPFVHDYVDFIRPSWADVRVHFAPNLRLFAPVIAISLYTSLDKIMLGILSGMEQAGYYEYAEKISKMPMSVVTALGTVLLPRMTSELSAGHRDEARRLLEESMWAMEIAALGLMAGISAITPEFVPIFFGPGYDPCVTLIPIVALVIPIISASNVIGVQYLLPTFSDKAYTRSVFAGAIVNIALNLVLLVPLGALGAAIATVVAELTVLAYQCVVVRHDLPLLTYVRNALPIFAMAIVMFLVVRCIGIMLGASIVSLLVEVVVGAIIYFTEIIIWCYFRERERLMRLLGTSFPKLVNRFFK
jgi:O-antigen/teichoic acid export membrane protein